MAKTPTSKSTRNAEQSRDARLKAALKANLAKRKTQRRVRAQATEAENQSWDNCGQEKEA
jgi:hypothetical protein